MIRIIKNKSVRGFSLVELMISMAISLFLVLGVIKIFSSSKAIFQTQEGLEKIQENQRITMNALIRDISSAGYMGCLQATADKIESTLDTSNAIVNASMYDIPNAVFGEDGGTDPDVLYIRRASEGAAVPMVASMDSESDVTLEVDEDHPSYASLEQWDIAVLSDCSKAVSFLITNDPQDENNKGIIEHEQGKEVPEDLLNEGISNSTENLNYIFGCPRCSIARIYKVGTARYYVGPSTTGNGDSLRVGTGSTNFELIEGVQDFQVLYGIDAGSGNTPMPTTYVPADQVADWNNVVSVKLTVTLTTQEAVGSIEDDGKLRKSFTTTIRMRNRAPS